MSFFSDMAEELGARRRRLRATFGDRGQGIVEFIVMAGLLLGSLGLLIEPWMPRVAPWGFALPFVYGLGFLLLERRRQRALAVYKQRLPELNPELDEEEWRRLVAQSYRDDPTFDAADEQDARARFDAKTTERHQARFDSAADAMAPRYDWTVFIWGFGCALAGAAAFVLAWNAQPAPPPAPGAQDWHPPASAVPTEITPDH